MSKTTVVETVTSKKQPKKPRKTTQRKVVKVNTAQTGRNLVRLKKRSNALRNAHMSQHMSSGSISNQSWNPQSSLTIPTNPVSLRDMSKAYRMTLADPLRYSARIPDGYSNETAIFRSVSAFNLPVSFQATASAGADDGRFSFLVQPIMGSTSTPAQYQIAAVNSAALTNWDNTANFAAAGLYLSSSNGRDVRLDPNLKYMAGGLSSYFSEGFTAGTTNTDLVSQGGTFDGLNTTTYTTVLTGGVSYAILPNGVYEVTLIANFTNAVATATAVSVGFVGNLTTVAVADISAPPNTPTAATAASCTWTGIVTSTGANNQLSFGLVNASTTVVSTAAVAGTTRLIITPAQTSTANYTSNGAVESIRPVAMSVLATFVGSTLDDGGQIAVGQYDADYIASNFFSQAASSGQAQRYENLQQIGHTFTGRLSKGVYCWWRPRSVDDSRFRSISVSNSNPFPGIICSGQATRPEGLSGAATESVLRILVSVAYEFTTSSTAFDLQSCIGTQNHVDLALGVMAHQPKALENPKHLSWVQSLLSDAGRFVNDNKDWIGPAVGLGLSLL